MGVVETWETRDRGGCSTALGEWERTFVSIGDEGSESEMHEEEEGERESEKEGEKVRRCEKAETGMQLRGRPWTERRASESIAFRRMREREGPRSDERRKNEGDEENANAPSTWQTRRKKKDGTRIKEGQREREDRMNKDTAGVTRVANALSYLSLSPTSLYFSAFLYSTLLYASSIPLPPFLLRFILLARI